MPKPSVKKTKLRIDGKTYRQFQVSFGNSDSKILVIDNHFNMDEEQSQNTFKNMCYEVCSTIRKNKTFIYTETKGMTSQEIMQLIGKFDPSGIVFADIAPFSKLSLDRSEYFYFVRKWKKTPTILTSPFSMWANLESYEKGMGNKALIGFNLKHLLAVTNGRNPFDDIDLSLLDIKPVIIKDIPSFDRLMKKLAKTDLICTDVEGRSLATITNTMFTIQIGFWENDRVQSYVIPWKHRDHTWSSTEFKHIRKHLRRLFLREDLENVFHFGQFDIGQLCVELNLDIFLNKVYDIPAAEFAIDENHKYLQKLYRSAGEWDDGYKAYSLEFVEHRYGIFRPSDMVIGKADRANMSKFSLHEIAQYGGFDIVSPLIIREAQLSQCTQKYIGHKSKEDFLMLLHHQLGIMIKTFALLKNTGIHIDQKNARSLVADGNIFTQTAKEIRKQILETKPGQKTNNLLLKQQGITTSTGMFSSQKAEVFSLSKPSHLRKLFFDVMKFEPTKIGKSGEPSADKTFQSKYKADPVVKMYGNYNKVKILKSTFADGLIKIIDNSDDFKSDGRLRPILGFLFVLTGRLSSTDPNCVTGNTEVLTKRGYVKITDVTTDDFVWTHRRRWKRVRKIREKGMSECIRLTLSNGKVLECTLDHQLLTVDGWKRARYIKVGEDFGGIDYVSYQKECETRSATVSETVKSDESANSNAFGSKLSDSNLHIEKIHARGGVPAEESSSILEVQAGGQKSTEREIWERELDIQRGLLRSQGISYETRVGEWEAEEGIYSQRYNSESFGTGDTTEDLRRTSHRRKYVEQLLRQLSTSDSKRTSPDTHGPAISKWVVVEKIENIGRHPVWDIAVFDDQTYFAADIVSHNSQNIPTRSDPDFEAHKGMVKAIKASFSVKHGRVMLGSDFSAHEVRMSGVIAKDPGIRATFIKANEAIRKFRLTPDAFVEAAAKVLALEGDVHIINVKFFFKQDVDKKHPLRDRIKAIVFGVLYGKLAKGLSKELKIEESEAQALIDVMFERWHYLKDWIDDTHTEAKNTFMVRYPNKRVAHMWAYLHDDIWAERSMDRRSVNYPIQGFASDIGVASIYCYKYWVYQNITRKGYVLDSKHVNLVHDAQYSDVLYEHLPFAIYLVEHSMSTLPMNYYAEKFGYPINTPLGYGLEFGKNWASLQDWNFRVEGYSYEKDGKKEYVAGLLDMVRDEGKRMDRPYDKVIADTKWLMKVRERELQKDPYKMLLGDNSMSRAFENLNMFKDQLEDA